MKSTGMWRRDGKLVICGWPCVGFENQTSSDSDMPLRVIAYDGMEYRAQLLKKTVDEPDEARKQERYPVITMVLYFGYEHLWNGPISLKDR